MLHNDRTEASSLLYELKVNDGVKQIIEQLLNNSFLMDNSVPFVSVNEPFFSFFLLCQSSASPL